MRLCLPAMSSDGFYKLSAPDFQGAFTSDLGEFKPVLAGDYYAEPDDVVRGLTLPWAALHSGDSSSFGHTYDSGKGSKTESLAASSDCGGLFDAAHAPPPLTEEIRRDPRTIWLEQYPVVSAFKSLLAFVSDASGSQITKMNESKFTVRADVFSDGLCCNFKARIYQDGIRSCVELRRRSGDCISFHRFYHRLLEHFLGVSSLLSVHASPPEFIDLPLVPAGERTAPLLEMADSCKDNVNLLAEVTSALMDMTRDQAVVKELSTPCARAVLKQLARVDDFRVSFPMSHLLSCI